MSLVLGKRPELFTRALMCSSQWDGEYEPVVKAKTPVYFVIGEMMNIIRQNHLRMLTRNFIICTGNRAYVRSR